MATETLDRIRNSGIVPVIKLDSADNAVPLGKALVEGGIPVAEVTFRTAAAAESITRLVAEVPELLVGAGTLTTPAQVDQAVSAGAAFAVTPGFSPAVVDRCLERGLPVTPGVNGPAGVEQGLSRGLKVLKFFPAEVSGGVAMLDALAGPYADVSFIPTGGIDAANVGAYARRPNVWAIGGSWMVKPDLIAAHDWKTIVALCREAQRALHGFTIAHAGVNGPDDAAARGAVSFLLSVFGIQAREGASSFFATELLEITKKPFPGVHGHLAIKVNDVERAVAYLLGQGIGTVPETAKIEKGRIKAIYLDRDILGFALHLMKA